MPWILRNFGKEQLSDWGPPNLRLTLKPWTPKPGGRRGQMLAGTGSLQGDVLLFRATQNLTGEGDDPFLERYQDPLFGWPARIRGQVRLFDVAGGHSSMLQEPQADALARQLQACVDEALGLSP